MVALHLSCAAPGSESKERQDKWKISEMQWFLKLEGRKGRLHPSFRRSTPLGGGVRTYRLPFRRSNCFSFNWKAERVAEHPLGGWGSNLSASFPEKQLFFFQLEGGEGGIRTHGGPKDHNGFRDRPDQPLRHLSVRWGIISGLFQSIFTHPVSCFSLMICLSHSIRNSRCALKGQEYVPHSAENARVCCSSPARDHAG